MDDDDGDSTSISANNHIRVDMLENKEVSTLVSILAADDNQAPREELVHPFTGLVIDPAGVFPHPAYKIKAKRGASLVTNEGARGQLPLLYIA